MLLVESTAKKHMRRTSIHAGLAGACAMCGGQAFVAQLYLMRPWGWAVLSLCIAATAINVAFAHHNWRAVFNPEE